MQYLKTSHKKIVNECGEEVILKGYAAGNWMVQEAFLLELVDFMLTSNRL